MVVTTIATSIASTAEPAMAPNSSRAPRPADALILLSNSEIARIKTKDGRTVAELSSGGKQLLLVFWRSLLCPFCREQMQDLSTKLASLRKLQTHVVMVYSATEKIAIEFFQRYNFTGYEDFVHYINDPECVLYDAFGVGTGNFFQTWVPVAKHPTKGFVSPGTYFDAMKRGRQQGSIHVSKAEQTQYGEERMSAVFVVRNGVIVNEMREFHNHDLPDFLDLAIDPKRAGTAQTMTDYSRFYSHLPTSVNREALQKFLAPAAESGEQSAETNRNSGSPPSDVTTSPIVADSEDEDDDDDVDVTPKRRILMCFPVKPRHVQPRLTPEEATMQRVLENAKARAFFSLFAARECSIENVRFWEEVHSFKKGSSSSSASEMRKRAGDIYSKFFTDESPLLLNITQELKDKVRQRLNGDAVCDDDICHCDDTYQTPTKGEAVEVHAELFDRTLLEVMAVLSDTFMRFRQSDEFRQMLVRM